MTIRWLTTALLSLSLLVSGFSSFLLPVHAQTNDPLGIDTYGGYTGLAPTDPRLVAARIITISLQLIGILITVLIVYAGYLWMTAGGNDDQVQTARKIITYAVVGLIIVLSAYAITRFVVTQIFSATQGGSYGTGQLF